jgi:hypothetical protein
MPLVDAAVASLARKQNISRLLAILTRQTSPNLSRIARSINSAFTMPGGRSAAAMIRNAGTRYCYGYTAHWPPVGRDAIAPGRPPRPLANAGQYLERARNRPSHLQMATPCDTRGDEGNSIPGGRGTAFVVLPFALFSAFFDGHESDRNAHPYWLRAF